MRICEVDCEDGFDPHKHTKNDRARNRDPFFIAKWTILFFPCVLQNNT